MPISTEKTKDGREGMLMNTQERLAFITEIATKDSGISKIRMMKYLYFLQAVHQVPFTYDFELYTYGPYCPTVISDLEYAEFIGYINISAATHSNGTGDCQISAGCNNNQIRNTDVIAQYSSAIDQVIDFFKDKTTKELDLYSTTAFVILSFKNNCWDGSKNEICQAIQDIKPHLSGKTISDAFDDIAAHFSLM